MSSSITVLVNSMVQLNVVHQYIGVAMGIVITARNVGGSVATTIYTVILDNQLKANLGKDIATALAKAGLPLAEVPEVTGALATGNLTNPILATVSPAILWAGGYALRLSYAHAFKVVYLVSIAFRVLAMCCALGTKNFGHLLTKKVDVNLEEGVHLHTHLATGHIIDHSGNELEKTRSGRVG
jgi:hypothetical protein